jgi:hypothetical protein
MPLLHPNYAPDAVAPKISPDLGLVIADARFIDGQILGAPSKVSVKFEDVPAKRRSEKVPTTQKAMLAPEALAFTNTPTSSCILRLLPTFNESYYFDWELTMSSQLALYIHDNKRQ